MFNFFKKKPSDLSAIISNRILKKMDISDICLNRSDILLYNFSFKETDLKFNGNFNGIDKLAVKSGNWSYDFSLIKKDIKYKNLILLGKLKNARNIILASSGINDINDFYFLLELPELELLILQLNNNNYLYITSNKLSKNPITKLNALTIYTFKQFLKYRKNISYLTSYGK